MASNGKGEERNVSWYAEHIVIYHGTRITIRYGKAAGQSTYRLQAILFPPIITFQSRLYHRGLLGTLWKERWFMAGKNYTADCSAICPEKMPVDVYVPSKVHQLLHVRRSILAGCKKKMYLRNRWIAVGGYDTDLKKKTAAFLFSSAQITPRGLRQYIDELFALVQRLVMMERKKN